MTNRSKQYRYWNGEFGRRYWERHPTTVDGFDDLRTEQWGPGETQSEVMRRFVADIDRESDVLEVGCATGIQLEILSRLGFEDLFGVDFHRWALERAQRDRPALSPIEATATALPFRDGQFDLVFTNETLITVPPAKIDRVMAEIVRCSNEWIWGLEFHADEYTEIEWRGEDDLLWKTDFCERYLENHDLELVDAEVIEYRENDDLDGAFLLRKRDAT
ncbi:pseudaminic acid biosynthesis-associated methylase [Halosolutus amylolyticus]|uniref:Pseudaminic acid biosynthesis-associated methylase n=1 Tax=Halosolutus amylolyticus TaxID=2932267 RepID=A0ABD5PQJ5_9EURY|nr:pseudaminic acid biosynthesis-associated methylase [Halosolutus amylolyticus]